MAVNESVSKITVVVKLNNGNSSNGNLSLLSVSLPDISEPKYNAQKVMNIVTMLGDCLSKPVYATEKVMVSTLIDE